MSPLRRDILCAAALAIAVVVFYAYCLSMPFDFMDDGNIVHAPPTVVTMSDHVHFWWQRTLDDYQTRGPFRPVYWAWYQANMFLFGDDVAWWRAGRLGFAVAAAVLFFSVLRQLAITPAIAVLSAFLMMIAPFRSSIWYRFGLGEAIALPMVLLALLAARRAASARRAWAWDLTAMGALLGAILVKNVFAAVLPAMVLLRVWREPVPLMAGVKRAWLALAAYCVVLAVPALHLVAFRHVQSVDAYHVHVPGIRDAGHMISTVARSSGLLFIGPGLLLALMLTWAIVPLRNAFFNRQNALLAVVAMALLVAGVGIYLPAITGGSQPDRYSIPAVLGLDMLIALVLMALARLPGRLRWIPGVAFWAGFVVIVGLNGYHQYCTIGRTRELWQLTAWLQRNAPEKSVVNVEPGLMDTGEVYHLNSHLAGLGRGDVVCTVSASDGARGGMWIRSGHVKLPDDPGQTVLMQTRGSDFMASVIPAPRKRVDSPAGFRVVQGGRGERSVP